MSLPSSSAIDSLSTGMHSMGLGGPSMHSGMSMPSPIPQGPVRRGVVKFFNCAKGFGFIVDQTPEQLGGQEVFCHFSAISGKGGFRSLAEGEEVEYELVQGPKGFQAANLSGPNGRAVVGDPKARLAKPPPYMPFAPMSMPPYLSDPYSQQHPGVYASSPYTQHVLYPSNNPLSSQYTYTSPSGPGGPANASTASEFRAFGGSYQQQQQLQQQQAAYSGLTAANYPSATNAQFGAPSVLGGGSFSSVGQYASGGSLGAIGGVQQLGDRNGGAVGARGASGAGGAYAFAPFNSPPTFNTAPLFAAPTGFGHPSNGGVSTSNGAGAYPPQIQQQPQQPQQQQIPSPLLASDPYTINGATTNGGAYASVPKTVNGIVGGARTGTPREERRDERRGTPVGLGNGTASGSVFAPVLFTTGDREGREYA